MVGTDTRNYDIDDPKEVRRKTKPKNKGMDTSLRQYGDRGNATVWIWWIL